MQESAFVALFGKVPQFFARSGVEAIKPFIAGPEIDFARDYGWTRFGLPLRLEMPEQRPGGGVHAPELAVRIIMKALPDEQPAIRQAGRGDHVLQVAVADKLPDFLAGAAVQAIEGANLEAGTRGGSINAIAGDQGG